jgi:diacylglycerol kinase (ATP)
LSRLIGLAAFDVRRTHSPVEMTVEARRAADDGLERVLVAGGDGALHYAIQGLAGSECALGIVPLGSGNDLARALGIERDAARAGLRALRAEPRAIDLGRVEGRLFAGVLGLGIDGDVSKRVRQQPRWLPGSAAYAYASLRAFVGFEPPRLTVEYDGGRFEGSVLLGALANSPVFGGGMRIAPEAVLDDGWLDLVIVEQLPLPRLLSLFPRVYRGRHTDHPAVRSVRVQEARFRCEPRRTFYADGEPIVDCDADGTSIAIWPDALRVIV